MGLVIPFPGAAMPAVAAEPATYTFDRARFRAGIEAAAHACMDMGHRLIELIDRIDGDPDFEPDADGEDDGSAEPALAGFVGALSQIRWVGFDQGGAA